MFALRDPTDLANVAVLRAVFLIWQKRGTRESWIWLAENLSRMMDILSSSDSQDVDLDINIGPFANALIAFSLVQGTSELSPDALYIRRNLALYAIDKYNTCRSRLSIEKVGIRPLPIESSLIGLTLTLLDDWPAAQGMISRAIPKDVQKRKYHRADVRCLEMYHDILVQRDRLEDLADLVVVKFRTIYPMMVEETMFQSKKADLVEVLFRALTGLKDPKGYFGRMVDEDMEAFKAKGGVVPQPVQEPPREKAVRPPPPLSPVRQAQETTTPLGAEEQDDDSQEHEVGKEGPDWEAMSEEQYDELYDEYNRINEVHPLDPPEQEVLPVISRPPRAKGPNRSTAMFQPRTRWLGPMMFMAFARPPHDPLIAFWWLYRLYRLKMWISPHHAADLGVMLAQKNKNAEFTQVFTRLQESHHTLSYSVRKRFLYLLLQFGYFDTARALQAHLIREYHTTISEEDRLIYARGMIAQGLVGKSIGALETAFGKHNLPNNPEALHWLLRLYSPRATTPKYKPKVEWLVQRLKDLSLEDRRYFHILLEWYADKGETQPALLAFSEFLSQGGRPDIETFSTLLRLFSRLTDMRNVDRMVQAAIESGQTLTGEFCAKVLDAGIRSQDYLTVARRYTGFPAHIKSHPEVVSAILRAFVFLAVPYDFVLRFFRRMPNPVVRQWHSLILSACDIGRMDVAESLLHEMYSRNGEDSNAPRPDVYIYTSLMHGYLRLGEKLRAKDVYDEMMIKCYFPTGVTYSMILSSYIAGRPDASTAEQAHAFAMSIYNLARQGNLPEKGEALKRVPFLLFGRLIALSGKLKRWVQAQRYYDLATRDSAPTIELKTTLLQVHRLEGATDKVVALWNEIYLQAQAHTGLSPDDPSSGVASKSRMAMSNILCMPLSITLDALGSAGRYHEMVQLWASVNRAGYGVDASNWNHYAIALARSGDLEAAFWIVDRILLRRYERVKRRARKALREGVDLLPVDTARGPRDAQTRAADDAMINRIAQDNGIERSSLQAIDDYPADQLPFTRAQIQETQNTPLSPSARRPNVRARSQRRSTSDASPRTLITELVADEEVDMSVVTQQLLVRWRVGDESWRPSRLLQTVLSTAYGELQLRRHAADQQQRSSLRFASGNGPNTTSGEIVTLACFNDAPIRGRGGTPKLTTARGTLGRLAHAYPGVVRMIIQHRKTSDQIRYGEAVGHLDRCRRDARRWFGARKARLRLRGLDRDTPMDQGEMEEMKEIKEAIEAAKINVEEREVEKVNKRGFAKNRLEGRGQQRTIERGEGLKNFRSKRLGTASWLRYVKAANNISAPLASNVGNAPEEPLSEEILLEGENLTPEEIEEEIKRIEGYDQVRSHLGFKRAKPLKGSTSRPMYLDTDPFSDPESWKQFTNLQKDAIYRPNTVPLETKRSRFPVHERTRGRKSREGMFDNSEQPEMDTNDYALLHTPELWELREERRRETMDWEAEERLRQEAEERENRKSIFQRQPKRRGFGLRQYEEEDDVD